MSEPETSPRPSSETALRARRSGGFRRAVGKIHFWLGLALAVYLTAVCLTGSILVYAPEISVATTPRTFRVERRDAPLAPVARLQASVRRAFPRARPEELASFRTFPEWNGLHRFTLAESYDYLSVYVDPYTAEVKGSEHFRDTLLGKTDEIHTSLALDVPGFILNGLGGLLSCLLILSGLWLWWPKLRGSGRAVLRRFAGFLWLRRGGALKRQVLDWHNVGGFWTAALLLLVVFTGSALIFAGPFGALVGLVTGTDVAVPEVRLARSDRASLPPDDLLARARAASGAAQRLYLVQLPKKPGDPAEFTFHYPKERWGVDQWTTLWLDPATGRVVAKYDSPRENLGRRVAGPLVWGWHVGNWWGEASRALYALLGLAPLGLSVTGTWLWLIRRRARLANRRRRAALLE